MIFSPFAFQQQVSVSPPENLPTIITSGLTIYVAAFDTTSYPGTGSTWTSLSTGTTYNGTLFNSPTFNSTAPKSFSFDGVDEYCDFGRWLVVVFARRNRVGLDFDDDFVW
jgi:hypothetical protein